MTWPVEPDVDKLIDDVLDHQDQTRHRMWRYRAVGTDMATALAAVEREPRKVTLSPPRGELRLVARCARLRGLSHTDLARQALATVLVREHGIGPEEIPWLTAKGLLP